MNTITFNEINFKSDKSIIKSNSLMNHTKKLYKYFTSEKRFFYQHEKAAYEYEVKQRQFNQTLNKFI